MACEIVKTPPAIPQFTLDQFEDGKAFEWLFSNYGRSPGALAVQGQALKKQAEELKFNGFTRLYNGYEKQYRNELVNEVLPGVTEFSDAPIVLECGNWECVDWGISRNTLRGREIACRHPILPVERLINIEEDDNVKYRLAYMSSQRAKKWRTVVVDRQLIASARSIVALSRYDISVTSSSASALVEYLDDVIQLNYDKIPEQRSVGRLGYMKDEGFSPYFDGLVFDGDASFRTLFSSVSCTGSLSEWQKIVYDARRMSVTARILLAASFASPLLSIVGSLPFLVHLWGVDSGTGKTVGLMLAASVWGDPALGSYTQTFNATQVGQERTAAFLNHLPLCIDELQLTKDSKGRSTFDVYQLAQGVGRARGRKNGGIETTPTWSCCFLTTGESPIVGASAGAGAVNRVIDIECTAGSVVVSDGHRIAQTVKENYGWAGKYFVEKLYESDTVIDGVRGIYKSYFEELCHGDSTEKQAAACAAILTADYLAAQWVYGDSDFYLSVEDIRQFMASKDDVSMGKRAYDWLCGWITANTNRFNKETGPVSGEVYGEMAGDMAYIIHAVFNEALSQNGFSPEAVKSYLRSKGLINVGKKGYTKNWRVGPTNPSCIHLHLPQNKWQFAYCVTV